ncbi:MAG: type II toxin-antitoxin system mRNA interferase toxin, RelE/StbE family [Candidatus Yonathbacteria bacterium]|nr:type II toxin-antitoxin system mRNA interferase toxin, RelE/StbE family [Candidatus Yonathbacteria bacterium]
MTITYGRVFKKMLRKQSKVIQEKFYERLALFIKNPHYPLLNNHALGGEWDGCRSINVTGDIRAVFEEIDDKHVEFADIGSHSELYS